MKKWKCIIVATVMAILCLGILSGCSNKGEAEEPKTLGCIYQVTLENMTQQDITGITLKDSGMTEASENKLLNGDRFKKGEKRKLVYDATKAVTIVSSGEAQCDMGIAFEDGQQMTLTNVPFQDMDACEIRLEDGVAFLAYVAAETEEEVTTKDAELKLKKERERQAAKEARKKAREKARKKAERERKKAEAAAAAAQAQREAEAAAQAQREAAAAQAQREAAARAAQQTTSRSTSSESTKPQNADGCIGNDEKLLY